MLEIEYVSDKVGIMAHGNLMVTGTPQELKQRYDAPNLEEVFERVVVGNEVL
jgi:ABC-2 type transport system ATP-binding protein